jgi:hypothetical protein
VRSLGLNPSQKDLKELISEVVDGNNKIGFAQLQPKLVSLLMENKMVRDDEAKIRKAFQVSGVLFVHLRL